MRFLFVFVLALLTVTAAPAFSQDYYRGKSITLFAGQPPGGGIDSEMRLVGQFYGKHIPGEPGHRAAQHAGRRRADPRQSSLQRRAGRTA